MAQLDVLTYKIMLYMDIHMIYFDDGLVLFSVLFKSSNTEKSKIPRNENYVIVYGI